MLKKVSKNPTLTVRVAGPLFKSINIIFQIQYSSYIRKKHMKNDLNQEKYKNIRPGKSETYQFFA